MVQGLIVAHVGELVGELADLTCPDCGMKFMEFRAGGRLGCPHDYRVFGRGLLPLGPAGPRRDPARGQGGPPPTGAGHRLRLRTQLREAIAREDYEEAARLRDQLRLKDADA